MSRVSIKNGKITEYKMFLAENSRPPSKGGNTQALHTHRLQVDGENYTFRALGSQQWAFKSDTISFDFDERDKYRNVLSDTIKTLHRTGQPVIRGNRSSKGQLRTAVTRMPGSRREQRD